MRSLVWIRQHVLGLVRDYSNIWLKVNYDAISRVYSVHVLPDGVLQEDLRLRSDINKIIGEFVEIFDESDLWFGNEGEWKDDGDPDFEAKGIFFDYPAKIGTATNGLEHLPSHVAIDLVEEAHKCVYFSLNDISVKYVMLDQVHFTLDPAEESDKKPEPQEVSNSNKVALAA